MSLHKYIDKSKTRLHLDPHFFAEVRIHFKSDDPKVMR
ncbi:hypothetical protein LEP1GSC193_2058 [Leptospira alstonii serovar Pingchang str. 80-412]|uniref:Uncharacterized protein n=2 Tax=Leptospira alstonii TaxID=28452 RepID=M6DBV7_9LEPT|nr:hypothetical protein LEP1GSC194_0539 [Leptospira alstonii serovar Sichuan str. 79601]EQA79766.1 hypothetical protein LEP1GSC193_2058 [Leptospira alstonii serovar Pingchang str. 80-412]